MLGPLLFWKYKINEVINKFLLTGEIFLPEMHLKQPEFTYSAYGLCTENKQSIKKFKETWDSRYIYQNEVDNIRLQHDEVYGYFKDLSRRTTANKVLRDTVFNIAKNLKYDGYQCRLASMVYKFFDKKTSGRTVKYETISIKELVEELHKPIIRRFEKIKVHSHLS